IKHCEFRTASVADNAANVRTIIGMLRAINPTATVVLSLSPVPLGSTSEFPSAIVADCLSKSTLRVAADQIVRDTSLNAFYWPSFEMVRWVSGHHGRVYGNDDGSSHHIDQAVIDSIIDSFIKIFASPELRRAGVKAPDVA